mmetsp:Transcript_162079/g.514958  ORF Transcript_162079/g.514958 Transcript_162079/m.514958 type:complete len:169 (-) Transcript_162079:170-676(-)
MGEEEGDWNATIEEWLLAEGQCVAGALASVTDGAMYAAAPVANEEGWGLLFKEPYKTMLAQEDGTEKEETIDESAILKSVAEGKRPAQGLWIAGEKYTITRQEEDDVDGAPIKIAVAGRPKKGVVIYITSVGTIIIGMFDETKSATQTVGNCRKSVHAFTEYMMGIGY